MLNSQEIRLLTEVGFLAATTTAGAKQAEQIFRALALNRPHRDFPYIGLALTEMNAGRADEAIAVLDRALRMVPQQEHDELNAFRGLALQVAGRNAESTRALQAAKSSGLAQAMLGTRIAGQEEI